MPDTPGGAPLRASAVPFAGLGAPLAPGDTVHAAAELGCEPAAIQAVVTVETGGLSGFLTDGTRRPRILFEAHIFGAATNHRWDKTHPNVSAPAANRALYRGGAAEYDRLNEAVALDRQAALGAASWGLFQILAQNWRACGFASQDDYVDAMCRSEAQHLTAFLGFVRTNGLLPLLRAHDWAGFARRYNGSAYRAGGYDTKLAAAYAVAARPRVAPPVTTKPIPIASVALSPADALNAAELARHA